LGRQDTWNNIDKKILVEGDYSWKKISIFLAPIFILAIMYGCSKDHNAPTFSQYEKTSAPTEVIATYDEDDDIINVVWTMDDTEGVDDYLVAWSDSNVFDEGNRADQYVKQPEDAVLNKEISLDANDVMKKMTYLQAADIDSFIVYFTVSAVYNNEAFVNFIGPRAEVDSALILR